MFDTFLSCNNSLITVNSVTGSVKIYNGGVCPAQEPLKNNVDAVYMVESRAKNCTAHGPSRTPTRIPFPRTILSLGWNIGGLCAL